MSFSRSVVVLSSAAMLAFGLVPAAPYSASAMRVKQIAGVPLDVRHADTEADAAAVARTHHHAVSVDSETTPTTEISALPNGTLEYKADSVPVRVRQNGTWVRVDTTLTRLDTDLWAPAASVAQVRFGAGGSDLLDKVQTASGDWITETWPYGSLPDPSVQGSTATYRNVLTGVDIRLTATASGMSDVLVIKSAAAAGDPKLASLNLRVTGASMAAGVADTAKARASDGSVLVSASPLWWDSSNGSDAKGPHGDAPARPSDTPPTRMV